MTAFYALCGSGCGLSGYFPNKVELIPHQSKGCFGEGCMRSSPSAMATPVDQLLESLPAPWRVIVQPAAVMGASWGCCWFPVREIWIGVRDPDGMTATLLHEVAHATLPPGEGHSVRWEALCRRLWREVL